MRKPRGPHPALMQLTDRQRAMRAQMAAGRRRPHDEVQRAAIMVQSADGARTRQLAEACGGNDPTIRRWRTRWVHAIPQLAAAEGEADEETLDGLLPQVWHAAPRRKARPDIPYTSAHGSRPYPAATTSKGSVANFSLPSI